MKKFRKIDLIGGFICLLMMLGTLLYLGITWNTLPDEIPTHYNFSGEVDGYGGKWNLLIMPLVMVITFVVITVAECFPESWNVGVKVTAGNKKRVYRVVHNLLLSMKLIMTGFFAYLSVKMISLSSLSVGDTVLFMLILFADIIFWVVMLIRAR